MKFHRIQFPTFHVASVTKSIGIYLLPRICLSLSISLIFASNTSLGQVTICYKGNMGIELRQDSLTVLIDALHSYYKSTYVYPSAEEAESMISQSGGMSWALFTHKHSDHTDPVLAAKFLAASESHFISGSQQFCDALSGNKSRVVPARGGETMIADHAELQICAIFLPHTNARFRESIPNYGYIVNLGGHSIWHLGDADTDEAVFRNWMGKYGTPDVLVVPAWFVVFARGRKIIADLLQPRHLLVSHIPAGQEKAYVRDYQHYFPDAVFLIQKGQELVID